MKDRSENHMSTDIVMRIISAGEQVQDKQPDSWLADIRIYWSNCSLIYSLVGYLVGLLVGWFKNRILVLP